MTDHVLFICTGNLCRSPMAAALLEHDYPAASSDTAGALRVSSAGLRALDGQAAHPLAQAAVRAYHATLAEHRARTVTPDLLAGATLILTMERDHRDWVVARMPALAAHTHLLGRWRDLEIGDPIGGSGADFDRVCAQIHDCLQDWRALLPLPAPARRAAAAGRAGE